ncbi:hypothetical protein BH09VER1_BH09VER1_48830 [soil metagenome]
MSEDNQISPRWSIVKKIGFLLAASAALVTSLVGIISIITWFRGPVERLEAVVETNDFLYPPSTDKVVSQLSQQLSFDGQMSFLKKDGIFGGVKEIQLQLPKFAAEASDSVSSSLRELRSVTNPEMKRQMLFITVSNPGSVTQEKVKIVLKNVSCVIVTKDDKLIYTTSADDPIELGDLRKNEAVKIMAWMNYYSDYHSSDVVRLSSQTLQGIIYNLQRVNERTFGYKVGWAIDNLGFLFIFLSLVFVITFALAGGLGFILIRNLGRLEGKMRSANY